MLSLSLFLERDKSFQALRARIEGGGCPVLLSGLSRVHRAHIGAALRRTTGRPILMVCPDEQDAERTRADLAALTQEEAALLVSREFTFYNVDGVSREQEHTRLRTLSALRAGSCGLVCTTADGLMQRTLPPDALDYASVTLRLGGQYTLEELTEKLLACGYKRSDQVEGSGQFAIRGGILDFFSPALPNPVRCEFFGDELDSMGYFDISTQRRVENLSVSCILPAAECLPGLYAGGVEGFTEELGELLARLEKRKKRNEALIETLRGDLEHLRSRLSFPVADRYIALLYPELSTALDYLPEGTIVLLCEPAALEERARHYDWQLRQDTETLLERGLLDGPLAVFSKDWEACCAQMEKASLVMLDSFRGSRYPVAPRELLSMTAKQLPSYGGSLSTAAGDILHYMRDGYSVVVLAADERRAKALREYLENTGIPSALDFNLTSPNPPASCCIGLGSLSAGMEYPAVKLAVITEGQLAAAPGRRARRAAKSGKNRQRLQSYNDLSPGDLVVHEQHGIGRFVGIFKMPVDGVEKDYVKIAYSGSDSLYVPATQLDMVSKYIGSGGEDHPVKLNKLGGTEWHRAKSRAKGAAKEMASQLIAIYAERSRRPGHAFAPDSAWQQEFEDSFEYTETSDQLAAIAEIKHDMEQPTPMDRLLCGDVGFGKTEVALRAVMKCVMDGKQAAILVPTTVLAQQHYVTATRRFSGYPVRIEVLSRFRSSAQLKQALRKIKNGEADIVIGTHRLIQKDVEFHDLGLLIVDEEQRFGVSHKEKLKDLTRNIDVLTLSATPIPRTLNMALSGLRDMSTIEEPPTGRHPVQTYVLEHDWSVLADAIRREVSRGGQVYYLHNRVETIERTAARISSMLEGVSVATAHGQMDQETLGSVMERMAAGEIQVLVCTTIIETGIDIPNVNTLIIEDADRLGLAQLHQIRGRVGRSSRHAFAYFTYRQGKVLSEIATKRLSTIREFAEFNSGFRIAMRDLEIRGAGNLLGAEQSGHMISVGFDMYLKLLEEAVLEEKGEKPKRRAECAADLSVSANIPESYVESPEQRMDLYRRIALIENEEDADDITDELIDRFGDPPRSVNTLIHVALLRGEAAEAGISEINQKGGQLWLRLVDFDMARISALYSRPEYRGRMKVEAGTTPALSLWLKSGKTVIDEAVAFVRAYKATAEAAESSPQ